MAPDRELQPFARFEPIGDVPAYGRCLVSDGESHRCRHEVVADTLEDVQDSLVAHYAMVHAARPLDELTMSLLDHGRLDVALRRLGRPL